MRPLARILLLFWVGMLLQACSGTDVSPEDEIRAFIDSAVEAAEARNSSDLANMIHGAYQDQKGYNKKQLSSLLRAYFFRHKNIHLLARIGDIELLGDNRAQVRMHVAMAGSLIADIDALSALRAQIYAFDMTLVKQDEWLVQHASWRPASIADLQ
ncbi:MAG: hypothetical protein JSU67_12285 [Gammaproteobacteria bacterium]|nr:MAG: hypothetical protein JSU67_12285 [Gammaproteobacteria bacterium]